MKKENKVLKSFSYFGTFVIVFIIAFIAIIMLWPGNSDDNGSNIKKTVIKDREQAREEMEEYLLEKYGESVEVSLPFRSEDGNFQAYVYNPFSYMIEIDVETGKCKDGRVKSIVEDYLKEKVEPIINNDWNDNILDISVQFFDDVPSKDWPVNSDPLDIIDEERMNLGLIIVVNAESIDKNVEASKVKQLIDLEELYSFNITCEVYYVNNEVYQQIGQTYQNSTSDEQLLMSIGDNYYNKLVVRYNPCKEEITTEEIIEDFAN